MRRKDFKCPVCHSRVALYTTHKGQRWTCKEKRVCGASGKMIGGHLAVLERIHRQPDILSARKQAATVGRSVRLRPGGADPSFVFDQAFHDRCERTRLREEGKRAARAKRRVRG